MERTTLEQPSARATAAGRAGAWADAATGVRGWASGLQLWLARRDRVVELAAGHDASGATLTSRGALPIGALVRPIHALAVLAALESRGLETDASVADVLCGRVSAHRDEPEPGALDELLAACARRPPVTAVQELVARPLGVHLELDARGPQGSELRASARAVGWSCTRGRGSRVAGPCPGWRTRRRRSSGARG